MKKIILAGVAGVAGVAALMAIAPGNAADLGRPIYRAPPAMVPLRVFSWTGCYIGGNIGWGWGRDTVSIPDLGETTGVPGLAGVSLPSVTGDTKGGSRRWPGRLQLSIRAQLGDRHRRRR
jgi:outer membrane immunogenic protein